MDYMNLFVVQLAGCVGFGAFIGEFHRTAYADVFSFKIFLANFLAGGFLAFVVAYIFYLISKQEEMTMLLGALLAYQDESFISRVVRLAIREVMGVGGRHKDG